MRKLGWHASDTAEIAFDDVFVPDENLLGPEHGGFSLIMANFQWERLLMALGAVGAMQACFEQTLDVVRHTEAARRPATRWPVRARDRGRTRCHLRRAAPPVAGVDAVREVTIAKLRRNAPPST